MGGYRGVPLSPGGGHWSSPTELTHCSHPAQGWLLSLLDDNSLHLWEIYQKEGCSHLEETRSFGLPARPGSGAAPLLLLPCAVLGLGGSHPPSVPVG